MKYPVAMLGERLFALNTKGNIIGLSNFKNWFVLFGLYMYIKDTSIEPVLLCLAKN